MKRVGCSLLLLVCQLADCYTFVPKPSYYRRNTRYVLTNKSLGSHVLGVFRRDISAAEDYIMAMRRLDRDIMDELSFNLTTDATDKLILAGKGDLKWYTEAGTLKLGPNESAWGSVPMYLKIDSHIPGMDEIILFRIIAGEQCLGLRQGEYPKGEVQYFPEFHVCNAGTHALPADDQLWAFFPVELVELLLDYDSHEINRHQYKELRRRFEEEDFVRLERLINDFHMLGRQHLLAKN